MAKGTQEGTSSIGHTGTTRYGAENAPVIKHGGNPVEMDGKRTEVSPQSMYKTGSYGKNS